MHASGAGEQGREQGRGCKREGGMGRPDLTSTNEWQLEKIIIKHAVGISPYPHLAL